MLTMQVWVPLAPVKPLLCLLVMMSIMHNFSVLLWIGFEPPVGWGENTNYWGVDGQYVQLSASAYVTLRLIL